MDRLRFTASGRLSIWDSIPGEREAFISQLASLLRDYAHSVIETDYAKFSLTDKPTLASAMAICDKIVARGNPTLIDLDFEQMLLNGPCQTFFKVEEILQDPEVGWRLMSFRNLNLNRVLDLITAAKELLELPFDDGKIGRRIQLPPELRELSSREEDRFEDQFQKFFGERLGVRLHRQVLIRDLVGKPDDELINNRVDFVFQAYGQRWVFEIDGEQHKEPGQSNLDKRRDSLLRENDWKVLRIRATEVRKGLQDLFAKLKNEFPKKLIEPSYNCVKTAISRSKVHEAAYYSIIVPLAIQRCLRGLLHLYSHEILDPTRKQRILVLEEDIPITVEAFRQLYSLWKHIHILAPETPAPPRLKLDVVGEKPIHAQLSDIEVQLVPKPRGNYDIVLSHGFFLESGALGSLEQEYLNLKKYNETLIRIRRAIGFKETRTLQWCEPLHYDLADVERSIVSESDGISEPIYAHKLDSLRFFLRLIFRKRDFWDGQVRVITRLLQGKPTIVLLPTGGGKSLTYQLSGLLLTGMTIVVAPLVSLITDQVENLKGFGIDLVGYISSLQERAEKDASLHGMKEGRFAFIYIAPERLQMQEFRDGLRTVAAQFPVSLAAIDEAHCISEWGHDFRPSYLHMPLNLQRYCSDKNGRSPTLIGLTGTASFAVLTDIQVEMNITDEEAIVLPKSFDRKELKFHVDNKVRASNRLNALKTLKKQIPQYLRCNPQNFYDLQGEKTNCGIVFCPHLDDELGIMNIAKELGHNNYYGGKKPKNFARDQNDWNHHKYRLQREFKRNRIQELVATNSFGMGIDKPNIRYTIHYTMPRSVEAFYQEAGRAGRNGKPGYALCSIIYSDDNWDKALEILNEPNPQIASSKLNNIKKDDRGDLLVQLWFIFNSYQGPENERKLTLDFWDKNFAPQINGMSDRETRTVEIPYNKENRSSDEKAIFRLMLVGVVQDYTIDWNNKHFTVLLQKISPKDIKGHLLRYLKRYTFEDFARKKVDNIPEDSIKNTIKSAVGVLINFIYDEIVAKRKQALRTMGELCRNFSTDQDFREAILAYLQESEFSDELRKWINHSFESIGINAIHNLLNSVTTLEEIRRLIGTTRRMLDEDPQNIALRYLSVCARAKSAENDTSVLQEATTLVSQVGQLRENLPSANDILLSILKYIEERRPVLLKSIGNIVLRRAGNRFLARMILQCNLAKNDTLYSLSLKLLTAEALRTAKNCNFYTKL